MNDHQLRTTVMQDLVDRGRAGDSGALNELIRQTLGRLDHLARAMLNRFPGVRAAVETEDVLQNALVRLLRALKQVRPASMRAFYGLAAEEIRRELLDLARHFRRHHVCLAATCDQGPLELTGPYVPGNQGGEQDDLDRWTDFHQAVAHLPPEEREVFGLSFYHGWTHARIAELLQVSERQVGRLWKSSSLHLVEALRGE